MGNVIKGNFAPVEVFEDEETAIYPLPEYTSREKRMDSVANAVASLFFSGLAGDSDEMSELADFLEEAVSRFVPPITPGEKEVLYKKSISAIKEMEKK